jgi:uncharacterized protein
MPSAHAAFVTALSVSVGLWNGFRSELFAVACVFSLIICYDAWRLRGAVQHQARILKLLVKLHPEVEAGRINENVGHSPSEIGVGLVVGGGFACLVYLAFRQL